jgi:hypothetical protein
VKHGQLSVLIVRETPSEPAKFRKIARCSDQCLREEEDNHFCLDLCFEIPASMPRPSREDSPWLHGSPSTNDRVCGFLHLRTHKA